jgi:hypothetical protein
MPFFWGLWDKAFNWDELQRFIAGYQGARRFYEWTLTILRFFRNRPVSGPGSTETDSGWIRHGPSRVREGKNGNLNLVVSGYLD